MTSVNRFMLILARVCPTACITFPTQQNHLPQKDSFFGNIWKSQVTCVHGARRIFQSFPLWLCQKVLHRSCHTAACVVMQHKWWITSVTLLHVDDAPEMLGSIPHWLQPAFLSWFTKFSQILILILSENEEMILTYAYLVLWLSPASCCNGSSGNSTPYQTGSVNLRLLLQAMLGCYLKFCRPTRDHCLWNNMH